MPLPIWSTRHKPHPPSPPSFRTCRSRGWIHKDDVLLTETVMDLQTRTRQLRFVLIEMDRVNVRRNSEHLLTKYNDVDAPNERLPEMHRLGSDLVELLQVSRPRGSR